MLSQKICATLCIIYNTELLHLLRSKPWNHRITHSNHPECQVHRESFQEFVECAEVICLQRQVVYCGCIAPLSLNFVSLQHTKQHKLTLRANHSPQTVKTLTFCLKNTSEKRSANKMLL